MLFLFVLKKNIQCLGKEGKLNKWQWPNKKNSVNAHNIMKTEGAYVNLLHQLRQWFHFFSYDVYIENLPMKKKGVKKIKIIIIHCVTSMVFSLMTFELKGAEESGGACVTDIIPFTPRPFCWWFIAYFPLNRSVFV